MKPEHLEESSLERLLVGAKLLEADGHGPKVYRLSDGNFLKFFRRKRLLSSALWAPYSTRFVKNAATLKRLGIPTVTPLKLYQFPQPGRTAVLYAPLEGVTLRDLTDSSLQDPSDLLPELVKFIKRLHQTGVYFRSLHLGNIVRKPEGDLGLIDISDMRISSAPLNRRLRVRNLEQFERYLTKEGLLDRFPFSALKHQVLTDDPK